MHHAAFICLFLSALAAAGCCTSYLLYLCYDTQRRRARKAERRLEEVEAELRECDDYLSAATTMLSAYEEKYGPLAMGFSGVLDESLLDAGEEWPEEL